MSILLVAQLLFALLESARNIEFYRVLQMNTDSVTESLFADYASPLWEDYRILGVTAADSGGQFSLNNREAMLRSISKTNLCSADGLYGLSGNSLLTADMSDVMFDEYMLVTDQQGKVFQALAASEYYHARSFFSVLEQPAPFKDTARGFIPGEAFEYEHLYPMLAAYAQAHGNPLAEQAYLGAARAEKKHAALLERSAEPDGEKLGPVYVCPICGYIMTGDSIPECCPVCGGPRRQYEAFGI